MYLLVCVRVCVCENEMTSISFFFKRIFFLSFLPSIIFLTLAHWAAHLTSSLHTIPLCRICAYDEFSYVCTVHAKFDADSTHRTHHITYTGHCFSWLLILFALFAFAFLLYTFMYAHCFSLSTHTHTRSPSLLTYIYFGACYCTLASYTFYSLASTSNIQFVP